MVAPSSSETPIPSGAPREAVAASGPTPVLAGHSAEDALEPPAFHETHDSGEGSSPEMPTFPELGSTLPAGFGDAQEYLDPDAMLGDVPTVAADQGSVFDEHEESVPLEELEPPAATEPFAADEPTAAEEPTGDDEPTSERVAAMPDVETAASAASVSPAAPSEPAPLDVAAASPVAPSAPIPAPVAVPTAPAVAVASAPAPIVAVAASAAPVVSAAPVPIPAAVATAAPVVVPAPPAEPAAFPGLPGSDEGAGLFPDFGYRPSDKGRAAAKGAKPAKAARTPSRETPRPIATDEIPDFSALGGVAAPAAGEMPTVATAIAPPAPLVAPVPSAAPVAPVAAAAPVVFASSAPPVSIAAPVPIVAAPVMAAPVVSQVAVEVAPFVAPSPVAAEMGTAVEGESASATRSRRDGRRRKGDGAGVLAVLSGPTVPKIWFVVAVSYASALTLVLLYWFLAGSRGGYDPYRLESLPDVTPADHRSGAVTRQIYPLAERVPPGHVLQVPKKGQGTGQTRRFGNVEITPLFVRLDSVELEHYKNKSDVKQPTREKVFKLWLRLKNVSTDQKFAPLDADLTFWHDVREDGTIRANNFVFPTGSRLAGSPRVPMFEIAVESEYNLRGQQLGRVLPPGASMDTYLASSDEGLEELDGELAWRLHLRKGYNPESGRGVTTLVEFVFDKDDVERPGA